MDEFNNNFGFGNDPAPQDSDNKEPSEFAAQDEANEASETEPQASAQEENPVERETVEEVTPEVVQPETQAQQTYSSNYTNSQPQQNTTYYSAYSPYSQQQSSYNSSPYAQQQSQYYNQGQYPGTVSPDNAKNKKSKKKGLKVFASLIAVVLVISIAFGAGTLVNRNNDNNNNPSSVIANSDEENTTSQDKTQLKVEDTPNVDASTAAVKGALTPVEIASKLQESVVGIICYNSNSDSISSEGTGIIMGSDSTGEYTYIVTCAHVVASMAKITVQLHDSTQYDAEIVGYDSKTDVGVVKIKAKGLTAAEFGDSSAIKVGEPVYAIGNPGGTEFFGSFTGGMVSAIDRSVTSTYTMECIQHDAAINPGNSGGALVNVYGQVIGINSLKIVDTEYEGMGFAIPIKTAKDVVDNLIAYGYVPNRPKLGITYLPATQSQQYNMIVQLKGLPAGSLIIYDIDDNSAFVGTEAQKYDLITAVNGKPLTTSDVLLDAIEDGKVGDVLTLTLYRIGNNYQVSTLEVKVTLIEDKGSTEPSVEEETTTSIYDSFFNNPFGF